MTTSPAEIAGVIRQHGQTMVLRRITPATGPLGPNPTQTTTDYTVRGQVRGLKPIELVGDLRQGDRLVVLAAGGIVPQTGDRLQIGTNWTQVIGPVSIAYIGATPALYRFTARG